MNNFLQPNFMVSLTESSQKTFGVNVSLKSKFKHASVVEVKDDIGSDVMTHYFLTSLYTHKATVLLMPIYFLK
jgi:hypothetical protein